MCDEVTEQLCDWQSENGEGSGSFTVNESGYAEGQLMKWSPAPAIKVILPITQREQIEHEVKS